MIQNSRAAYRGVVRAAALASAALSAACADSVVTPATRPAEAPPSLTVMNCTVTVRSGAMSCGAEGPATGGARGVIYGGQNQFVRLANTPLQVDSLSDPDTTVVQTSVTVQNLLPQQSIGTVDGTTLDSAGVKIFYQQAPAVTGGSGYVRAANADGEAVFLSNPVPYYRYDELLDPNEVSAARTWRFELAPTVRSFSFKVYVSTRVEPLLVINEIMPNPGGTVQDSVGEYVELYNAGPFAVDLRGFILRDNTAGVTDTVKSSNVIAPGAYFLLGRSANTSKNGGITPDYLYTSRVGSTSTSLTFSNSGSDFFVIKSPTGVTVDSVFYTSGTTTAVSGVARELRNPFFDNTLADGSNWGAATPFYDTSNANRGTPKAQNSNFFEPV